MLFQKSLLLLAFLGLALAADGPVDTVTVSRDVTSTQIVHVTATGVAPSAADATGV